MDSIKTTNEQGPALNPSNFAPRRAQAITTALECIRSEGINLTHAEPKPSLEHSSRKLDESGFGPELGREVIAAIKRIRSEGANPATAKAKSNYNESKLSQPLVINNGSSKQPRVSSEDKKHRDSPNSVADMPADNFDGINASQYPKEEIVEAFKLIRRQHNDDMKDSTNNNEHK